MKQGISMSKGKQAALTVIYSTKTFGGKFVI